MSSIKYKCCFCEGSMNAFNKHDANPLKPGDLCCDHCFKHYVNPSKKIIKELQMMAYRHSPTTNVKSAKNKKASATK